MHHSRAPGSHPPAREAGKRQACAREARFRNHEDLRRRCKISTRRIQVRTGRKDVTVHQLQGDNFWLNEGSALFRARQLDREVNRFLEYLSSPEATKKEIDRRLGNFHDIEYRGGLISRSLEAGESALRPSHLKKVFEAVRLVQERLPPV